MSNVGPDGRSYLPIDLTDLQRLKEIAEQDRKRFFKNHLDWAQLYQKRVLCVTLCQGAAEHYATGKRGINDFDIWTFYKTNPLKPWCYRRNISYDFGDSKFGQSKNRPHFLGRRVDCLGRDILFIKSDNLRSALERYLQEGKTKSARLIAQKPVVLLEPDLGKIIWHPKI